MPYLTVTIQTLTGEQFQLLVSPYQSVSELKRKIQKIKGIPIANQHLIWDDHELHDTNDLADYRLPDHSIIQLVLGMRGGPINARRHSSRGAAAAAAAAAAQHAAAQHAYAYAASEQYRRKTRKSSPPPPLISSAASSSSITNQLQHQSHNRRHRYHHPHHHTHHHHHPHKEMLSGEYNTESSSSSLHSSSASSQRSNSSRLGGLNEDSPTQAIPASFSLLQPPLPPPPFLAMKSSESSSSSSCSSAYHTLPVKPLAKQLDDENVEDDNECNQDEEFEGEDDEGTEREMGDETTKKKGSITLLVYRDGNYYNFFRIVDDHDTTIEEQEDLDMTLQNEKEEREDEQEEEQERDQSTLKCEEQRGEECGSTITSRTHRTTPHPPPPRSSRPTLTSQAAKWPPKLPASSSASSCSASAFSRLTSAIKNLPLPPPSAMIEAQQRPTFLVSMNTPEGDALLEAVGTCSSLKSAQTRGVNSSNKTEAGPAIRRLARMKTPSGSAAGNGTGRGTGNAVTSGEAEMRRKMEQLRIRMNQKKMGAAAATAPPLSTASAAAFSSSAPTAAISTASSRAPSGVPIATGNLIGSSGPPQILQPLTSTLSVTSTVTSAIPSSSFSSSHSASSFSCSSNSVSLTNGTANFVPNSAAPPHHFYPVGAARPPLPPPPTHCSFSTSASQHLHLPELRGAPTSSSIPFSNLSKSTSSSISCSNLHAARHPPLPALLQPLSISSSSVSVAAASAILSSTYTNSTIAHPISHCFLTSSAGVISSTLGKLGGNAYTHTQPHKQLHTQPHTHAALANSTAASATSLIGTAMTTTATTTTTTTTTSMTTTTTTTSTKTTPAAAMANTTSATMTAVASRPIISSSSNAPPYHLTPSSAALSTATQRCAFCNRKTGLASSYACRCGANFCSKHRYAEAHNCCFDYKSQGRQHLEAANPLVTTSKLPKI